jgi:hypothetical protein
LAIAKTLDILLRAPTSKLDSDFKKAQQLTAGFVGAFKGLVAPLLGALSFGGVVVKINAALRSLDDLAKRSVRFNVDPSGLQALELAAGVAGVQITELEVANRTLTKHIESIIRGVMRSKEIFGELVLSAEDLSDKALPEQLRLIAVGMENIEGKTRKNALALELFGRSGNRLLPMLANEGKQLVDAMADVERLVGSFSKQDVAQVEGANDAWTRLMMTFNGIFQRMAIDMAPALQLLYTNLAEAIKPGTALNEMMKTFGDILTIGVYLVNAMAAGVSFLSNALGVKERILVGTVIAMAALITLTKTLAALYVILRIRTLALAAVETFRLLLTAKGLAIVGAAAAGMVAFKDQLTAVIKELLGATDAQLAMNDAVMDFDKIQGSGGNRKLNLSSATAGSQAALEQLFTVRGEQRGMDGIKDSVNRGNAILEQIRDGVNASRDLAISVDVEEIDL